MVLEELREWLLPRCKWQCTTERKAELKRVSARSGHFSRIFSKENTLFSAPAPTTAVSYVAAKCVDVRKNHHKTRWLMPWGPNKCNKINDFEEAIPREIEANDIVFSVHIPLPSMEMSPWFQFMLFILQIDIAFKLNNQISKYSNCYGHLWEFSS